MKRLFKYFSLPLIAMSLAACSPSIIIDNSDAWTIMIYMCGSDLESVNSFATMDIREILSVNNQPNDVNIIIETGGSDAWHYSGIDSDKLDRFYVRDNKLNKVDSLTYSSMGSSSTFQSFLEWGLTSYPAKKTGVILWNHGGAMSGVCQDETTGDSLLNSELKSALSNAFKKTNRSNKLEWIGYDACLMNVQDIAETNSDYFNYMVAAQESEAGEGWSYSKWLPYLYNKSNTKTILSKICDTFIADYETNYGRRYDNDQTLSVLDLNSMSTYKSAWESFSSSIGSCITSYGQNNFYTLLKGVKEFGTTIYNSASELSEYGGMSTSSYSYYYYGNYGVEYINGQYVDWGYNSFGIFDVIDFLDAISNKSAFSSLSSKISEIRNAYDDLVIYNATGDEAGNANGLCFYFPMHSYCQKGRFYTQSETRFTNWRNVVSTYGK